MKPILVVEDSPMVVKIIRHVLSQSSLVQASYASSFAEARECVEKAKVPFFAALVDLTLPDADNGEVVDYTLSLGIPTIVLTSSYDEKRRELLVNKGIVDYVTKEGRYSYEYALGTLHRLIRNSSIKVLVVDDSSVQRRIVSQLLGLHLFQVLEAEDGVEAIRVFLDNPDIKLIITDYNMPNMDGFDLIRNIRVKYEKTDLGIIGVSSESEGSLSAKFIKFGASDFLKKPFNHEEFYCRINHNIDMIEMIEKIRDSANRDELTGIFHRQYFFKQGRDLYARACDNCTPIAAAVIDLDHFGEINDNYGNDFGDQLMRVVAKQLEDAFGRFFIARADGQEFYVLMPGLDNDKALSYVGRVRQLLSGAAHNVEGTEIAVTFTVGVSNKMGRSLDDQMHNAMRCLKRAKEAGRDLVVGDD